MHYKTFLLRHAQHIIVEGSPVHNIPGRLRNIGCLVYNHRRISGACRNTFFSGSHGRLYNAFSARHRQKLNIRMVHDNFAGLHIRLLRAADQTQRPSGSGYGSIENPHSLLAAALCGRVRLKYDRIARRNHAYGIIDNRRRRIGGRRNRTDNAIGRRFHQRHPTVPRKNAGNNVLRSGRFIGRQQNLPDLIRNLSISGFLMGHSRQFLGILHRRLTHGADQAFTRLHGHAHQLFLSGCCRSDAVLRPFKQPALSVPCGLILFRRAAGHLFHRQSYDLFNLLLRYHLFSPFIMFFTETLPFSTPLFSAVCPQQAPPCPIFVAGQRRPKGQP